MRWDAERANTAYKDGWWVHETLGQTLEQAATNTPDRILIVDGEIRISARTLYKKASSLAHEMLSRTPPGSVVSFMLPNWHEAATIYMAATLAGMVANPILPSLRDRELLFILKDVCSRLIFTPEKLHNHDYGAMMSRVAQQLEHPPEVVIVRGEANGHIPYTSLFERSAQPELPQVDPDAVRMVLYTSGTTGTPKGVMHSHNSIHALIKQIGRYWLVEPGDVFLVPSPISHIGGSIYAFECPLLLEATAVLMDRWDADAAVQIATAERCTHIAGATPFLEQMLEAAIRAGTHMTDLKLFVCGGASVPPSLIRNASSHFTKTAITRVYGSTEVPVTTIGAPDRRNLVHAAESDGRVGIAEVKLIDASGQAAEEGEIRARGPQMLVGYLHAEDEASVFDEQGYYRTGDIGRWLGTDYLVISGRAKDIIIRKGENISPKEVEDFLVDHPNIAEVAIVGLPNAQTGERAYAAIIPKTRPGPDVSDLKTYLRALGVATFKIPEEVVLMDSLPKNDAGKVLKHQIRTSIISKRQEE